MLEGKTVSLRVVEKEDFPLIIEWSSKPEFWGEFFSPFQLSRTDIEREISGQNPFGSKTFLIEKKDGAEVG